MLRGWRFAKLGNPKTIGELMTALNREFSKLDGALSYSVITAGRIQNAADTAGILVDSVGGTVSVPATWTRFLNLGGTSAHPSFLKHDKLELQYDGSATFRGIVDIAAATDTYSFSFGNVQVILRDTDVAHGMTSVTATDVNGLAATPGTAGGLVIAGLAEATAAAGLALQGFIDNSGGAPPVAIQGWKKSGTDAVAVGAGELLAVLRAGDTDRVSFYGDGAMGMAGDLSVSGTATFKGAISVSATAAFGVHLSTDATTGFVYVPTCSGTPTGTPVSVTGCAPIVIDRLNNKLYFYSGGAWRDAGP